MDPTPDTPFRDIGPEWTLSVRCSCRLTQFIHAYREKHFAPDMTAAQFCAKGTCKHCGGPVIEAAWESAWLGSGGLPLEQRTIRVV